jgi:hypothetical protein
MSWKSKLGVENWSWERELGVEVASGSQESTLGTGVGNPSKEWESGIQVRSGSRESKSWTRVPRFSCKLRVGNWEPKMTPEFKNAISMQGSCLGHRKYCKEVWFVHGASWTNCIKGRISLWGQDQLHFTHFWAHVFYFQINYAQGSPSVNWNDFLGIPRMQIHETPS